MSNGMRTIDATATNGLKELVEQRKRQFGKIIDFMGKAVREIGVTTHYVTHNDYMEHTQVVQDLRGFDLTVDDDGSYRWMTDYIIDHGGKRVLNVSEQGSSMEVVTTYVQGPWESRFACLMGDADRAFAAYRKIHPELDARRKEGDARAKLDSDQYYGRLAIMAAHKKAETPEQKQAREKRAKEQRERELLEKEAKKLGLAL
ncbi:MAG: hypothetical protein HY366_01815 [Candidatus Aenigmarchaeota archaeon]|nr:hypothetical protein [Candidatus Aenigmarchaeota archaeon]